MDGGDWGCQYSIIEEIEGSNGVKFMERLELIDGL